ncbi:hypothetical protein [Streptomyces sp. NPDC058247]|uniref:hypothetical protein n=1 Tax=Streptomyces sp. NPDC058247 TaxID=3346401 RepID=UPI0036E05424
MSSEGAPGIMPQSKSKMRSLRSEGSPAISLRAPASAHLGTASRAVIPIRALARPYIAIRGHRNLITALTCGFYLTYRAYRAGQALSRRGGEGQ